MKSLMKSHNTKGTDTTFTCLKKIFENSLTKLIAVTVNEKCFVCIGQFSRITTLLEVTWLFLQIEPRKLKGKHQFPLICPPKASPVGWVTGEQYPVQCTMGVTLTHNTYCIV